MDNPAETSRRGIVLLTIAAPFACVVVAGAVAWAVGSPELGWFRLIVPVFALSAAGSGLLLAPKGDFGGGVLMGMAMGPFALPVAYALARHRPRARPTPPSPSDDPSAPAEADDAKT